MRIQTGTLPTWLVPPFFGCYEDKVEVGRVRLPGVEIGSIVGPETVGRHRCDNGTISLNLEDTRNWVDDEHNGLVYTCRGGFVDMAHVRDNADITSALASGLARNAETGGSIELPSQGAKIRAVVRPIDPRLFARHGARELIIPLAQWLDFQVAAFGEPADHPQPQTAAPFESQGEKQCASESTPASWPCVGSQRSRVPVFRAPRSGQSRPGRPSAQKRASEASSQRFLSSLKITK